MMEIPDTFRGGHDAEIFGVEERYEEGASPSPFNYGIRGSVINFSIGVRGRAPAEN